MATAAFRALLPTVPSRFQPISYRLLPSLTFSDPILPNPKTSLFLHSSPHPLLPPLSLLSSSASAASASVAAYAETDGETASEDEKEASEAEDELFLSAEARPRSRSPAAQEAGRLYVGNLPFSMTPAELAEIFAEAGTVDTVEVMYDRVTDRSRGFAFVTMASVEEANEAIRMFDGSQVGGRMVKVNFPEVPRGGEREVIGSSKARGGSHGFIDSPYKVYAGNLGWSVTSQSLRDAFAAQPGLLGAKVIFDHDTGRSRGFGFVSFASDEDAQAAIEAMNGLEVEGRPLRLSPAMGRPSTGSSPGPVAGSSLQSSEEQTELEGSDLQSSSAY